MPVFAKPGPKKMSIKHDTIMDFMLVNPTAKLSEIAAQFDVTQAWLSCIIHSDAFRIRLAKKQEDLFNGTVMPLREKVVGIAHLAVDRLGEKVEKSEDANFLHETTDMLLHRLGWAPQRVASPPAGTVNLQQNFYQADPQALAHARARMKEVHTSEPAKPQLPPPEEV